MDDSQIKKELALRIKAYRKSKNLSQDEFGALIGFEQKNISRLESGRSMPETKTICKLLEAGIDSSYLFGFINTRNESYSSEDFEIVNLLINLPEKAKEHFKSFLLSLKEKP